MTDPDRPSFLPVYRAAALAGATLTLGFLAGCGGVDVSVDLDVAGDEVEADWSAPADLERTPLPAEVIAYMEGKINLPPEVFEAVEAGRLSQEELQSRKDAGEFDKFFVFATIDDLPADLPWEDGSDLPDIGSPDAKKGGTSYGRLQDFPRTLRTIGPDSNGSFRPYILDDTTLNFAHRHPNRTEVTATGHRYFPGLAEAWAVVPEEKTVYVRLNPEARWSDGVPITTDDVLYMFYFYQSPHVQAPWYNNFYNRNYTNITQYDEHTFSITVPEAKPDMNARVLELRALPSHFFGVLDETFIDKYQWQFQPTSGPYVVFPDDARQMQKGRFIRLVRNGNWWAKDNKFWRNRFNYNVIHLNVIRDTPKAFEAFRKGELDVFSMNLAEYHYDKLPNDAEEVEKGYIKKYSFYNDIPRPTYGLWINSSRPLLDDQDVRVGINYASNWQRVIDEYFRRDYIRMRTTADGFGDFTHPTLTARPYDVEKALEHFAKAGFTDRNDEGILVNAAGQELAFTITTGYSSLAPVLTILQEEALAAGLDFRIEVLDSTAGWKKGQEKKHDILFSAFGVGAELYPRYWETYHSVNAFNADGSPKTQTNNLQMIAVPELDALIERYRASESAEEMMQIAFQMEEIIADDGSFVPGFVQPFFRWAAWRWRMYPDDGNVKLASGPSEFFLGWMDEDVKRETMRAMRSGETFPQTIEIHDQYNTAVAPEGDAVSLSQ